MKILVISTFPSHPVNAGNISWINTQCRLLQDLGHEVHYLFVRHPFYRSISEDSIQATARYWGNSFHLYQCDKWDRAVMKLTRKVRRKLHYPDNCWTADSQYPRHLSNFVQQLNDEHHFGACIVQYYFLTRVFADVIFPRTAISTHDCFSYRNTRVNDLPSMYTTLDEERKAMQRCGFIFALQDEERFYFQNLSPNSRALNVFSYYKHIPSPVTGNHNIVMLSSSNVFNTTATRWFLDEVVPQVKADYPDAQVILGGSICKALAEYSTRDGIQLLGYVDDAATLYNQGDVAINPVSQGTGLKIKTFEAVQYDKVTIVHPHSTNGVFEPSRAPMLVAESVQEWIEAFHRIWDNPETIHNVKQQNRQYLQRMNDYVIGQYQLFLK